MTDANAILGVTSSTWLLALLGCVATVYILKRSLAIELDPLEPPILAPKIPFVGHVLGMIWYQNDYFGLIEQETRPAAYTMPVLKEKIYVIAAPELIQSSYRNSNLSFEEFFFGSMGMLSGISAKCQAALAAPGLRESYVQGFTTSLSRENLHRMNVGALRVMAQEFNRFPAKPLQVDNFAIWLRDLMTLATTTALFGSKSPFIEDSNLAAGFWVFEGNSNVFNSSIPSFVIKKELDGRAAITRELTEYFERGYDSEPDASPLVQHHAKLFREHGFSNEEVAKIHFATIYAALSNTFPTFYFTIMHIFSDCGLLEKLRLETEKAIQEDGSEATIDIAEVEDTCSLLSSVYREFSRVHFGSSIIRKPVADTTISDGERSYLLKKGRTVMLRVPAMHHAPGIWGQAIDSFDGERFLDAKTERASKKAFTPFGGGKHLCPGRNFAQAEIMGVALALTLGFEITGPQGGSIPFPDVKATQLTHLFGRPKAKEDMRARISRRLGWEDIKWKYRSSIAS